MHSEAHLRLAHVSRLAHVFTPGTAVVFAHACFTDLRNPIANDSSKFDAFDDQTPLYLST